VKVWHGASGGLRQTLLRSTFSEREHANTSVTDLGVRRRKCTSLYLKVRTVIKHLSKFNCSQSKSTYFYISNSFRMSYLQLFVVVVVVVYSELKERKFQKE
jgi:hypothetical protein